ncbi:MAG: DUF2185 domain-containing protein [Alphaproteobacteria bacterium HGW-Alphaproteobacteria-18]|nr:MAG: DUF2185 domain-containing protein [Alphaproteobacteria bacterium HGW-Alphaproteobacteria-18]
MGLKDRLYNARRRIFGRYDLDDPRPIAIDSPYTFYLPDSDRLQAIEPGDSVKIIVRSIPAGLKYDAERLWLEVLDISEDGISGKLDSVPLDIPQLQYGDVIRCKRWHVIDYIWKDKSKENRFPNVPSKQRWDRCLVDCQVVDGTARVGYLYREEPDMTRDGDGYPDSGWRIRADVELLSDEEYETPNATYIAIGKVLNKDDSWLHLIDAPVGTAYLRNSETGLFEETEFTANRADEDT